MASIGHPARSSLALRRTRHFEVRRPKRQLPEPDPTSVYDVHFSAV
jgi:hypothetical protein